MQADAGAVIDLLQLPYTLVTGKLNIAAATIRSLVDAGLIEVTEGKCIQEASLEIRPVRKDGTAKQLSAEQQAVVDAISQDYSQESARLICFEGITGSGKTKYIWH